MDKADKKILYLLHKNSRIPLTRIAKRVGISKDSAGSRIKKMSKTGIIKRFTIDFNHKSLGFNIYTIFLRFKKLTDNEQKSITGLLRSTRNVTYVASCSGNWDLWVEVLADSIESFDTILNEIVNSIGDNLKDYKSLVIISEYKAYSSILGSFFENYTKKPEKRKKQKPASYEIDKTDYLILKELEKNSRLHQIEIAETLDLTVDIVRYRIRCMEEEQIIKGYTIQLDFDKIGYSFYLLSLYFTNLSYENEKKLRWFLNSNQNIRFAYKAAGRQEIILEVLTKDINEFQDVVNNIRNRFYDILENYEYLIIIDDYKEISVPVLTF